MLSRPRVRYLLDGAADPVEVVRTLGMLAIFAAVFGAAGVLAFGPLLEEA